MPQWTNLTGGFRALFRGRGSEREMDDELRQWLDAAIADKIRSGMSPAEARRSAMMEMGSVEFVKEEIRAAGWESAVEAFGRDLRFSFRVLRKSPLFTAVVVLTLALGIGANTAIFSLIDAILLRSLPVGHPEELVQISRGSLTNPLWEQLRDRQDIFSGIFAWSRDDFNLARSGMVQSARGLWVSGDFFRTLGLQPAAGRLLTVDDDRRGCAARAVLSYGYWMQRYGGADSAIGQTITLDGHPFQIIGVAPAGFFGMNVGSNFDIAVPICSSAAFDGNRSRLDAYSWWWLNAVGRRKPGVGMAAVKARLAALSPSIFAAAVPRNWDVESQKRFRKRVLLPDTAATGLSMLRRQYEQPLRILMAVVGLVLLIASANIAGLMMARAAARGREMAMRLALGASRFRLVRQLMTECCLLSLAGAALGLGFARWGNTVLVRYLSTLHNPVFLDLSLDGPILGFTTAIAILTGLLFGVAPAFSGTRALLTEAIKETHASDRGIRRRFRLWIVASQIALSMVLLVTAGLLLRSFRNLATLDLGFDPGHVLVVAVTQPLSATAPETACQEIEARLRALPGVVNAARSWNTPLGHSQWNTNIRTGVPDAPRGDDALAYFNRVSNTYFDTLRMQLLAGRNFKVSDTATSTPVAVINQALACRFFPGLNPVGRTYRAEGPARILEPPVEIIGVVKDAKYESVREDTYATVFRPISQMPEFGASTFEVRTPLPESVMAKAIRGAVAGVNPEASLEVHTLAAQVDDSMTKERVLAALAAFFGAVALLLAMIGLYGTLAYLVNQRRVEFGIRMALGAPSGAILRTVMRDVLVVLAGGMAAGIGLALGVTRLLGSLLFGLDPRDAATLALSALLLALVSLAAGYLAARRATDLDPMTALRHD
ncbi:MAG: ABC transporter permease [Acidobacteria bacterium]|nr:ABC transporter permease [Acidobacteriota bacterium]